MAFTPQQGAILELLVRRQELNMEIRALRNEYEHKSAALAEEGTALETLNAEYASEMRIRESQRVGVNSMLSGEKRLHTEGSLGMQDFLQPLPSEPTDPDDVQPAAAAADDDPDDAAPYKGLNPDGEPPGLIGAPDN